MTRQGIQSVEIGLRVLEVVSAAGTPLALKNIAAGTGLTSSQTHKYLVSLINGEMVYQNPDTGLYSLGPAAVRVGLSAIAGQDAIEIAASHLRDAVNETGRMGLLSVMGPQGVTVIRIYTGDPSFVTNLSLGSTLPLTHSATGHAFLGFMDNAATIALAKKQLSTDKNKPKVKLTNLIKSIKQTGHTTADNIVIPGLRAVAIPIFNLQQEVSSVATLVASEHFSRSDDETALEALQRHCNAASQALGGNPKSTKE
jgi:DNA-binding IclR family transcriptional regulator